MKIAIIGSGISGLLSAYHLSPRYEVTVYEKEERTGGMCSGIKLGDRFVDKYNHFFSKSDKEITKVIGELGLSQSFCFKKVKQASIKGERFIDMSNPLGMLASPGLNFYEKLKLALFFMNMTRSVDGLGYNEQSLKELIEKKCTPNVFNVFFRPLMEFKFHEFDDVSASYLWARLNEKKQNAIGHLKGGMAVLVNRLQEELKVNGANVLFSRPASGLKKINDKTWRVIDSKEEKDYDCVVSTIPLKQTMLLCHGSEQELQKYYKLSIPDYLNVCMLILRLKQPLRPGYWLFMVEQINRSWGVIIDTSAVSGHNLIYFPVYRRSRPFEAQEQAAIFDDCLSALKKINNKFKTDWILDKEFSMSTDVEPVLTKKFIECVFNAPGAYDGLYIQELIYEKHLLKTINTQAIKARHIANKIQDEYAGNNTG